MVRRGNRSWEIWQAATDYVVNLMLHDAGFTVPKWVKYFDEKYRGLNVEQVCLLLEKEAEKKPKQPDQPGQPQQGDGGQMGGVGDQSQPGSEPGEGQEKFAPSYGDPGGTGEVLDAAPPYDQAAKDQIADEWQVFTRQAASVARRQGAGTLPGFIEEILAELTHPRVDWRHTLRRFVDPNASTQDFSTSFPNRRMMAMGYFVPGLISDGINHIGIVIDTSGSIDYEWLKLFGGGVQDMLDEGAVDKITLIFADTSVRQSVEYSKGDIIDFNVKGRGGTEFAPTFNWLNENAPDIAAAIYFTDLDCSNFGPEPTYPVLWACHDSDPRVLKARMERVPFGECLELIEY